MMTKTSMRTTVFMVVVSAVLFGSWKKSEPLKKSYPLPPVTPMTYCGSFKFDWQDTALLVRPRILEGLGNLHYRVSTKSEKAQAYFEQGLRLVYGFNHWEAIQSFTEATRIDPGFAMAHWGLALAFGPNLNDWNPVDRERMALESIQTARRLSSNATTSEKDFIEALAARYDGKAHDIRDSLNNAYAVAMKALASRYPEDHEVQTLYADAIMNTMPWNYYESDGTPKVSTREARKVLEHVLLKFPDHAGAHHLYIHLMEASTTPEAAVRSARFLETAMPGAGHIVHMPAHIYFRTGEYARGVDLNIKASQVDEDYLAKSANQGTYRQSYYPHNVDFVSYGSYMDGRSALAIQTALKLAYKSNFSGPMSEYFLAEPMLAYTRFGKWNDILSLPDPGTKVMLAQVLWRFSRGLAFVRSGYTHEAYEELKKLDSLNRLDTLKALYITFNPISNASEISSKILRGEILLQENRVDEAIRNLEDAVRTEDGMQYTEPPDWKIPARHYLGAALLQAERAKEAERVFSDDLKINRENGWSLNGLYQAQTKLGKRSESTVTKKRLDVAWKNADIKITGSRF